jgi:hypothetical protein
MCSGRVEPAFILEALKDGADGILITGCHIGDCHYIDGNRNAEIRINNTMEALKYLGLDGRLRLEWVSASEGARFAEVVKETDILFFIGGTILLPVARRDIGRFMVFHTVYFTVLGWLRVPTQEL